MQFAGEIFIAATGAIIGAVASYFAQNRQDEKISLLSRLSKLEMDVNTVENTTIQLQGRVQTLEGATARIEANVTEIKQDIKNLSDNVTQKLVVTVAEIKAIMKQPKSG
jgi:predicted nuclease with TOPRIM domain